MSLRNQPLRRGLIAGFAVTLFGSLIAIGCVQGPKGAFNRVWGPESYAAKTTKALKGLGKETAVDEEKEKLADSKDAKKKAKKDALAQASGKTDASMKGGVGAGRSSKKSELASTAKKGDVAAPYVKKRNTKLNEIEDPFLKDFDRTEIAAKSRKPAPGAEIAANTRKPAPSTALNAPKPANVKPGVAFAKGFDTQLTQIKADVAREKALAEAIKKKAEADATAMAAARREVDALLTQARAADKRGDLDEAKKLAHTADDLVASRKILLTAGEERPEDFLQKIREKQVARENAKKLEIAAAAAPQLPDDDGLELRRSVDVAEKSTPIARKEPIARAAKVPAHSAAKSIDEEEEVAQVEPAPRVQIKVQRVAVGQPQPRHLAAEDSRIESRPASRMTIQRSAPVEHSVAMNSQRSLNGKQQIRETDTNDGMIFDSHVVDWRFPIQNRTSPAASDYEEVQVSYEEVARRNSQRGRVTANGTQWSSSKEGRVRTNRGSVVNANGERARLSRGESTESTSLDGRIQMSSHTVRDGQFAEVAGKRMTDTSPPELLESTESVQPVATGIENKPAEASADSRASSSNGWSFLLGVAVAAICAVGFAFRNRGQIEKPRS